MSNEQHGPTITTLTQIAAMLAALLTFFITSILVAGLYFTTPLFGLLAASTLTLALGGTGIGLLVIGLSIAAYFFAQAILGAGRSKHADSMTSGADDPPPFTPSSSSMSNSHSKKFSDLNKGASQTPNSFEGKDKLATDAVKKSKAVNKANSTIWSRRPELFTCSIVFFFLFMPSCFISCRLFSIKRWRCRRSLSVCLSLK